jgi:hypothetical protein
VPNGSYISHHTAAELWGAAVPVDGNTHVTLPSARGRQVRQGIRSHYRKDQARTTLRNGLPVSTPEQTYLDLAAVGVGLVDLVVVADGMVPSEFAGLSSRNGGCTFQRGDARRLKTSGECLDGGFSTR